MSVRITWLSHAAWQIQFANTTILIDPFFTGNPASQTQIETLAPDYIFVTHGHGDHVGDTVAIAKRTQAPVICNYEIATWLEKHGVRQTHGMNLGGWIHLPFGRVQFTTAIHSSQLPDGSYGGNPGGFLFEVAGKRIYLAGDTALFSDMQLYAEPALDVAILPIGDFFTMGPADSIRAVRLISPRYVLPSHFGTWPPIAQDAGRWAEQVRSQTQSVPLTPAIGETVDLP